MCNPEISTLQRQAAAWLLGLTALLAPAAQAQPGATVRLGALSVLADDDTQRQWQPLAQGLQAALGRPVHLQTHDLAALEAAVARGAVDFVVTNPGHYVALEARHGAARIATLSAAQGDPAHAVGSAVVVRAAAAGAAPATLADLRGWRVAAVAEEAFGGYQLAAAAWLAQDVDAEEGGLRRIFTGYPMQRVAQAVLAGQADAGILRTCLLEQWERQGIVPAGALHVVPALATGQAPGEARRDKWRCGSEINCVGFFFTPRKRIAGIARLQTNRSPIAGASLLLEPRPIDLEGGQALARSEGRLPCRQCGVLRHLGHFACLGITQHLAQ